MGYADKSMIAKIEKGQIDLTQSKILSFAEVLHIEPSDLMGWENDYERYNNIYKIAKKKIPLLGTVACGTPIYADENIERYVKVDDDIEADFCLKCKGDSMINARIHDGDIVFVKKQGMVNNGEIAVVIIDDSATLKRFYYYKQVGLLILKAENPNFPDLEYMGETLNQVRVIGKAVAFQSDIE